MRAGGITDRHVSSDAAALAAAVESEAHKRAQRCLRRRCGCLTAGPPSARAPGQALAAPRVPSQLTTITGCPARERAAARCARAPPAASDRCDRRENLVHGGRGAGPPAGGQARARAWARRQRCACVRRCARASARGPASSSTARTRARARTCATPQARTCEGRTCTGEYTPHTCSCTATGVAAVVRWCVSVRAAVTGTGAQTHRRTRTQPRTQAGLAPRLVLLVLVCMSSKRPHRQDRR